MRVFEGTIVRAVCRHRDRSRVGGGQRFGRISGGGGMNARERPSFGRHPRALSAAGPCLNAAKDYTGTKLFQSTTLSNIN